MMTDAVTDPYHALGLTRNPFVGNEQLDQPDHCWIDRGWSQAPQSQAGQLIQVIGDKGFGKTSHLKYWQAQTGGPYCYVGRGLKRFVWPPISAIAYWDEANRIPIPLLVMALYQARLNDATIVMGTHCDRGFIAKGFGFQVRTIHLMPLDENTLISWATRLIKAARLPNHPCCLRLSPEKARQINQLAQGSWRRAADHLHIWAAEVAFDRNS